MIFEYFWVLSGCVCDVLQCVAVRCSVLQCVAVCCSVLQCVAVCCSVLQCVAVCCSVLQCVTCTSAICALLLVPGQGLPCIRVNICIYIFQCLFLPTSSLKQNGAGVRKDQICTFGIHFSRKMWIPPGTETQNFQKPELAYLANLNVFEYWLDVHICVHSSRRKCCPAFVWISASVCVNVDFLKNKMEPAHCRSKTRSPPPLLVPRIHSMTWFVHGLTWLVYVKTWRCVCRGH